MQQFLKNISNSKLLIIAIVLAFLAWPFSFKFIENETVFLACRLLSFVLFVYVTIRVINNKTKGKTTNKK